MPRKTQPDGNAYPSDSLIYTGPPFKNPDTPVDYPSAKTLKTWVNNAALSIKQGLQRGYGFLLNAKEPEVKDKVKLLYNKKAFHYYNDRNKPYYIGFSQWFYDGAWTGNEPGWIKVSFDKDYKPEDALVIIRLSGYGHLWSGGSFDVTFEGKTISVPHTAGYNNYQAVAIPIVINKSHPNKKRITPLGDIIITARQLGSWNFYDAKYDSFQKIIAK